MITRRQVLLKKTWKKKKEDKGSSPSSGSGSTKESRGRANQLAGLKRIEILNFKIIGFFLEQELYLLLGKCYVTIESLVFSVEVNEKFLQDIYVERMWKKCQRIHVSQDYKRFSSF